MENQGKIILTDKDFQNISLITNNLDTAAAELLDDELSRAIVVSVEQVPKDVVTMNSTIKFADLESGKESQVTLVYPNDANISENKISILAPIGSALIGLRVGEVIDWPVPNGKKKKLKVVAVLSQN